MLPTDTSIECFIAYLKQQNAADDYVSSLRSMNFVSAACKAGAESEKSLLVQQTNINLQQRKNSDCLGKELTKSETLPDLLLNLRVIRTVNDGNFHRLGSFLRGTKTPKDSSMERIDRSILAIVSDAETSCELQIEFASLFDSFFDSEQDDFVPYEDVQDFCIKKELSEKLLLDLAAFNIKMKPRNDNIDCNSILLPLKAELIESLKDETQGPNKHRKQCVIASQRDSTEYFYLLLKAELLSKHGLTVEKKLSEKNDFVDNMTRMAMEFREKC